jgi:hypothetical protein
VWLTRLDVVSSYAGHVLPPLLLVGVGVGLAMPTAMSQATLGVRMSDQGVASATTNTSQQIGGAVSTALLNSLANTAAAAYVAQHLRDPLVQADAALHGYHTAFWWAAGFYLFGAVVTALLFRPLGARGPMLPARTPTTATTLERSGRAGVSGSKR